MNRIYLHLPFEANDQLQDVLEAEARLQQIKQEIDEIKQEIDDIKVKVRRAKRHSLESLESLESQKASLESRKASLQSSLQSGMLLSQTRVDFSDMEIECKGDAIEVDRTVVDLLVNGYGIDKKTSICVMEKSE